MKKFSLVALCLATALVTLVIGHARTSRRHTAGTASHKQEASQKSDLEVEVIKLKPGGFEPSQLSRPSGKFVLVIQNATGKPLPAAQLYRSVAPNNQQALLSVSPLAGKMFEELITDLEEGSYIFKESASPYRQCVINVSDPK